MEVSGGPGRCGEGGQTPQNNSSSDTKPPPRNPSNDPPNKTANSSSEVSRKRGRKGPLPKDEKIEVSLTRNGGGACEDCRRKKCRCIHAREEREKKRTSEGTLLAPRPHQPTTDCSQSSGGSNRFPNTHYTFNPIPNDLNERHEENSLKRYVGDEFDPARHLRETLVGTRTWKTRRGGGGAVHGPHPAQSNEDQRRPEHGNPFLLAQEDRTTAHHNRSLGAERLLAPHPTRRDNQLVHDPRLLTTPSHGGRGVSRSNSTSRRRSRSRNGNHPRRFGVASTQGQSYMMSYGPPSPSNHYFDHQDGTASVSSYLSSVNTGCASPLDFDLRRTLLPTSDLYSDRDFGEANTSTQDSLDYLLYNSSHRNSQEQIPVQTANDYPQDIPEVQILVQDLSMPAIPYNPPSNHHFGNGDTMPEIPPRPVLQRQQAHIQNLPPEVAHPLTPQQHRPQMRTRNTSSLSYSDIPQMNNYSSPSNSATTLSGFWGSEATGNNVLTPQSSPHDPSLEQPNNYMQPYSNNLPSGSAAVGGDLGPVIPTEDRNYLDNWPESFDSQDPFNSGGKGTTYGQDDRCDLCAPFGHTCNYHSLNKG